jgi:putative ATP-binding cassette transporter
MTLLAQFSKMSPNLVTTSIILGVIAGGFQASIIPLILMSIDVVFNSDMESVTSILGVEVSHAKHAYLYFSIMGVIFAFGTISQVILSNISISLTSSMRRELIKKVSKSSLRNFEQIGQDRVFTGVVNDINDVVYGASQFPTIVKNIISVFGLLAYLAIININILFYALFAFILGFILITIPSYISNKYFNKSRDTFDLFQLGTKGLLDGVKELRLSESKREDYISRSILKHEKISAHNDKLGFLYSKISHSIADLTGFITIGFIAFVMINYNEINYATVLSAVMIIIYITGPIGILMAQIPTMSIASIALEKLNMLYDDMNEETFEKSETVDEISSLEFKNVMFSYNDTPDSFGIGPLNFKVISGELVFVIGGNGSGKSTLSKIITQHYLPTSGEVLINGRSITERNILSVREKVSAIYTDFHLFTELLGDYDPDKVKEYLIDLGLSDKVKFENGQFSTVELSDGQKKRLALLVALMNDSDIYLLDEWAADQDPEFKDVFYRKILKEIKEAGKLIIVITHDDHYFDLADRFLIMRDGEVSQVNNDNDSMKNSMILLGAKFKENENKNED